MNTQIDIELVETIGATHLLINRNSILTFTVGAHETVLKNLWGREPCDGDSEQLSDRGQDSYCLRISIAVERVERDADLKGIASLRSLFVKDSRNA